MSVATRHHANCFEIGTMRPPTGFYLAADRASQCHRTGRVAVQQDGARGHRERLAAAGDDGAVVEQPANAREHAGFVLDYRIRQLARHEQAFVVVGAVREES